MKIKKNNENFIITNEEEINEKEAQKKLSKLINKRKYYEKEIESLNESINELLKNGIEYKENKSIKEEKQITFG